MSTESRDLPADFGPRLRAAAGYMGLSIEDFASQVDRPGASASTMKTWIRGPKQPSALVRGPLIERLAEVSDLPEDFFWGSVELPSTGGVAAALRTLAEQIGNMDAKLSRIAEAIEARPAPLKAGDLEELVDGMHSIANQAQEILNRQGPRIGKRDLPQRAALDRSRRRREAGG